MNLLSEIEVEQLEHEFFGKKARERRQQRREDRQARKLERIDARRQGGGVLDKVGSLVSNVFGGGNNQPINQVDMASVPQTSRAASFEANFGQPAVQQQNNQRNIMIIVGVLIVAVLVFMIFKKKKK